MSERWLTGALLLGAAGYVVAAAGIPLDPWAAEETINTRTLPLIYGGLLALLALAGFAVTVKSPEPLVRLAHPGLAVALVLTLVAFATAVVLVGIWLAIPVALVPAMVLLGERRWWLLGALPSLTAVALWVLVTRVLGVFVPAGTLLG